MKNLDAIKLDEALRLLEARLQMKGSRQLRLVVCGGSALIAANLLTRTTQDVDVVALMDGQGQLINPHPLPPILLEAASEVAQVLGLNVDWLNDDPSRGRAGYSRWGSPKALLPAFPERIMGGVFQFTLQGGRIRSTSSYTQRWIEEATISPIS